MSDEDHKQKGIKSNARSKVEVGARRKLIEELFNDFNRSRIQVYRMNFVRGLYFGFGSVLGGTILVALSVWLLSILGRYIPFFSDFFRAVGQALGQS